jgi:Ca2+:H+ antiporter
MVTNELVQPPRPAIIEFAGRPMNWLFAFIPITLILDQIHTLPPTTIFFSAALSIIPIAALIVESTEQLATRTGDAIGGLLNATFGNAPELIISFVALRAGYLSMVRASLIGAIMANLLLALGLSFLLGGLRNGNQKFNPVATRTYSTMMFVAAVSLAVPSAFSRVFAPTEVLRQEQLLNIGISIVLLAAYGLFLLYSLKTHKSSFEGAIDEDARADDHEEHHEHWSLTRALVSLIGASVLAALMSEVLVGAAEGTGKQLGLTEVFIGIVFLAVIGGAAESGSAIVMARKNKMDLSIGIALGSSIQIALFVAPVLVLASYFIAPKPLDLAFNRAEIGGLGIAVLIGSLVSGDGQSNWFKGVQLLTIYAIIGLMFYLIPAVVE